MRTRAGYELPRILTAGTAARIGITRSAIRTELRRGRWRRLAPGIVLTAADPPSRLDWAEAGIVTSG
ncbi:MAG TPA: hypothetical protein VKB75_16060, partial [Jatrophihabitans sp.]|nr:hypothetical protein [Jatrophihabitans sp.]